MEWKGHFSKPSYQGQQVSQSEPTTSSLETISPLVLAGQISGDRSISSHHHRVQLSTTLALSVYLWRRGQGRVHIRNGELGLGVSVVQERVVDAVSLCLVVAKVKLLLTIASEK